MQVLYPALQILTSVIKVEEVCTVMCKPTRSAV